MIERSSRLQDLLIYYNAENNLELIVEEDEQWTSEHGTSVVNALNDGTAPPDFTRNVKPSVDYAWVVDEPHRAFEILSEDGGKQQNIEDYLASTMRTQHQQTDMPTYYGGQST